MNTTFSLKSFIGAGWQTFKKHWKFIVLAGILTAMINMVLEAMQRAGNGGTSFIVSIFAVFVGMVIMLGWSRVFLALNRTDLADWNTFKTESRVWLQYIKAMIWYFLYYIVWLLAAIAAPVIVGLIGLATHMMIVQWIGWGIAGAALVGVSVYFSVRYQFIKFIVLDYPELRSREAFKKSAELSKGYIWKLIGFGIVLGLLNILGAICLFVGLVVTIPVSKLAKARAYDYLKQKKSGETEIVVRPEEVAAPVTV